MTLTQEINKTKSVGDDGVSYPYGFRIWDKTDLRVIISNKVAPLEKDELTLDTDYTVAGVGLEDGGTITLIGNYAIGETPGPPDSTKYVTCIGELEYKQETGLKNQGVPEGNVIERFIDKLTRLAQQLKEGLDRCLKVDETSDEDPEDHTYESFVGTAPVDDSGFAGVLSGATATVQGCFDQLDTDAAPLASPALTGNPTVPTQSEQDGTTKAASCAYADRAAGILLDGDSGAGASLVVAATISDYDLLRLELLGIQPVTDGVSLRMYLSEDGGSSWISDGTFVFTWYGYSGVPGEDFVSGNTFTVTHFKLCGSSLDQDNDATAALYGSLLLTPTGVGTASFGYNGSLQYRRDTATLPMFCGNVFGRLITTGRTINAIKMEYGSGNIAAGTIRLWGLPKGS